MPDTVDSLAAPRVVSRAQWLEAHAAHLAEEKQLTRMRDRLAARRRELPWVKVDKPYTFDAPGGKRTLGGLFEGRSQLIVKHFMFAPGWKAGCVGCSFESDHVAGALMHLEHHDVSYVAISRATLPEIEAFKQRMGWRFNWVSSFGSDFNYDYNVSFMPEQIAAGEAYYNYRKTDQVIEEMSGLSVFYKDEKGEIYHTFSAYGRGAEEVLGAYIFLDLTPKGRNETGPHHDMRDWVRHHDCYDDATFDFMGVYQRAGDTGDCCGALK